MSDTITRGQFRALVSELGETAVREKYAGRGMFGEHCIGFSLDSAAELADLTITLEAVLGPEKGRELARSFSQDAMGHGVIFYARGWEVEAAVLKTWHVETTELREIHYQVQAEDAEQAREKIANGDGEEKHCEFHSFHDKPADWDVSEIEPEDPTPPIVPPKNPRKKRNGAGAG